MLISFSHSIAIMSLQTHIIHWRKLKKFIGKRFPKRLYETRFYKNHLALAKTNHVSKYTLSVQKLCYPWHKYKGSSKKCYPFIILVMSSKYEAINLKLHKY